ncbi:Protein FAR1-RELATED SEQUENCE 5 [Linum perenne]
MDFGIDDDVNGDLEGNIELDDSQVDDQSEIGVDVIDGEFRQDLCKKLAKESPGIEGLQDGFEVSVEDTADEPYIGLEFDSEAAAHAFYNSYATRVGFVIRVSKLSRSRRDGSAIGRALVCNKEGFRMPDKREKIVRQRAETRVGCRAMILVRKISSGKWTITKFVKEHTHPLTPGRGRRDCIYDQYPNEHDKIRELSQQLAAEKKRAATYKRHLELIFEQIEEQNQCLSNKIRHIVQSVRDIDREDQQQQQQ